MAYTADEIADAIRVSKGQGFSDDVILQALASRGVTKEQAAAALAPPKTYTPEEIQDAIAAARIGGFSEPDIATGLERFRVPVAQTAGLFTPTGTTYTPEKITEAIRVSREQGFNDADIAIGLQRYLPTPAAVTTALTDNPRTVVTTTGTGTTGTATTPLNTSQTALTPINRPLPPKPPTYKQVTPASFTQTAIANTPYQTVYTPSTMQQATDAQIQAAMQTSNPYMSLMSLTPQRTMPMSYAGPAGVTAANTNLGGFNPAIYNPAAATGLLTTPGAGVDGGGGVPGGAERGAGNDGDGTGQTGYGVLGNLAGEAQRAGFNTLGGFLASGIPVGAAYRGGNFNTADLAALGSPSAIAAMNSQNQRAVQDAEQQSSSSPFDGGGTGLGLGANYDKFEGGLITPRNVRGPNPPGPDDGNTNIDIGEYVIRKSAVKKYGANIFEQINAGRIPAQRLKSLLE